MSSEQTVGKAVKEIVEVMKDPVSDSGAEGSCLQS
jgi:hypothetical protein